MMEEDGSDVIEMTVKGEKAAPGLIRPDLDLVIVTARDEKRLCLVEVDTTDRTIVLFETIN
jgi:hypothetical protein